jgi:hypothetical protein
MLAELTREDRLRLMKFVCAFAWADLEVKDSERRFVERLIEKLELADDRDQVVRWLKSPPAPEEVDPTRVPAAHRDIFLDAARKLFESDGEVDPKEREQFALLEQLMI